MNKLIYAFLLVFFALSLSAQSDFKKGFIITLENDTVFGLIDYRGDIFNATNCMFKLVDNESKTHYNPREIKSYRITDGKYYVSREVEIENNKRTVFLEYLVNGRASLYYMPDGLYFIELQERELMLLENTEKIIVLDGMDYYKDGNEYVGMLKIYMEDCPEIRNDIKKADLDQTDLIKITTKYHNLVCPDEDCIVYRKAKTGMRSRLGVSVGTSYNMLNIYYYDGNQNYKLYTSSTAFGPIFGLSYDVYSIGSFERLFTSFTISYSQVIHKGPDNLYMHVMNRNLLIGYMFNYIYPRNKMKPFIGVGGMYLMTFHNDESYFNNVNYNYNPGKKSTGPTTAFGCIYDLNESLSFKLQADYFYGYWNLLDDYYRLANTNNLNLTLSIQYSMGKKK